jgi:hypothetical protein
MSQQQALPRRRVVSPPLILAAESTRLLAAVPHLWRTLPPQTQVQFARILAELLRRMMPTPAAPEREMSHVDRRECR